MGKKKSKKNPWITPSESSGSEPETAKTESEGSSVEERDDERLQEVLESGGSGGDGREREGEGDADV